MTRLTRNSQRGSAMLVTLILISALLAGVAVIVSLQMGANKGTELTRSGMSALYCAEAGLAAAKPIVGNYQSEVDTHLNANPKDAGGTTFDVAATGQFLSTYGIDTDVDNDGVAGDFEIYIYDNEDETSANDYNVDADDRVYIVSKCVRFPDTPKAVMELVEYVKKPTMYDWQDGRGFGNGNANAY